MSDLAEHTRWAIAAAFSLVVAVILLAWRAAEAGTELGHRIDIYAFMALILMIVSFGFSRLGWRVAQLERQAKPPESAAGAEADERFRLPGA